MALSPQDLQTVRQMIQAQAQAPNLDPRGLLRPGTIQSYAPSTRTATVIIDGDLDGTDVINLTQIVFTPGNRVMIQFQAPSGAYLVGPCGMLDPIGVSAPSWGQFIPDGGGDSTVLVPVAANIFYDSHGFYDPTTGIFTIPEGLQGITSFSINSNAPATTTTRQFVEWEQVGSGQRWRGGSITGEVYNHSTLVTTTGAGQQWRARAYQLGGGGLYGPNYNLQIWLLQQTR